MKKDFRKEIEIKLLEKGISKSEYAKLLKISISTLYWRLDNFEKLSIESANMMLDLIGVDIRSIL